MHMGATDTLPFSTDNTITLINEREWLCGA